MDFLTTGEQMRKVASTHLNEQSSRSHSVFRINIKRTDKSYSGDEKITTSEINLVDLAGSEGASKTKAKG